MPHYKFPNAIGPEAYSFTENEWREMITAFLKNETTEYMRDKIRNFVTDDLNVPEQTLENLIMDKNEKAVIFWTQHFVGIMKSVYEETYIGHFDEVETMLLPRDFISSFQDKFRGFKWLSRL